MKLTQKELAVHMGFSSSETISQIERNEREIKAWELSELANALAVNVNDLLQEEKPEKEPAILWRQTPKNQKETKEAVFIKRCRRYALLEKLSE
ncbi:MAG: helix-turn-helix transcriptional regulator [Deltaproteobacteria bacterium]|nr:helix-turn-helix transcriptional regulator [Deltaproteobacteria bacterium]